MRPISRLLPATLSRAVRPALVLALAGLLAATGAPAASAAPAPAAAAPAAPTPSSTPAPARVDGVVEGQILVGFEGGAPAAQRTRALGKAGARRAGVAGKGGAVTLARVAAGADEHAVARTLAAQPGVAFAEPNYVRHTDACADCWQLGPRPGVDAAAVHAAGRTGTSTSIVAVVDSGVAPIADLTNRLLSTRSCDASGACAADASTVGNHGTTVASLIVARDDATGITGVAPNARVKSWRAMTASGGLPALAIAAALDEIAADPGVDVVSMSLSGVSPSQTEAAAVARVLAAGKLVVASAGNSGGYWPAYPASYPGVISVGATDRSGNVADFSGYGKVDVVAPGVCVPASAPAGATGSAGCPASPRPGVVHVTGTSFSTPLVSGILALGRSPTARRSRLGILGTADATAPAGLADPKRWGHGLADAAAWHASLAAGAAPYLVVEPEEQLVTPGPVTSAAYVQSSTGALQLPSLITFAGLAVGALVPNLLEAGLAGVTTSGRADTPGTVVQSASATGLTGTLRGSAPIRVLRPDDQAPGVPLDGAGPWTLTDTLQGGGTAATGDDDLDDVRAVTLTAGQTLTVRGDGQPGGGLNLSLYTPATTDVFAQIDVVAPAAAGTPGVVASGPSPDAAGDSSLTFRAVADGTYLVDAYALGARSGGAYTLDIQVG